MKFFRSVDFVKCEIPSGNFVASARALAKLGNFMANKGTGLISEQTWENIHSNITSQNMGNQYTSFTKGGFCRHEIRLTEG